jgi:hypothetical protein
LDPVFTKTNPTWGKNLKDEPTSKAVSLTDPAPSDPFDSEKKIEDLVHKFYDESTIELLPLSPKELKTFRRRLDQRAKALTDSPPRSLLSRSIKAQIGPGLAPTQVTLTPGLVTALVFTTPIGQPWPVVSSVLGDGSLFSALIHKEASHQILVSPLARHGDSNLLIGLKGLDQPLMVRLRVVVADLEPHGKIDGLVNFQIQNANLNEGETTIATPPQNLALIHDLMPGRELTGSYFSPEPLLPKSQILKLEKDDSLYLRTPLDLSWPTWKGRVTGPGAYKVYEIGPVAELVVIDEGRLLKARSPFAPLNDKERP